MLQEYASLGFLLVLVVLTGAAMILFSHFIPGASPTAPKKIPYESGMTPLGGTRERFSVKFYLVAMLFIVFDLEAVFMIPWAVSFRSLGLFGLVEMMVFVVILFVGLVYAWKRGALEWD